MVAKFLDDNKAKTSLKKWIPRTVSNFIAILFNFFLFLQSWRNCRGLNPKGPYLSLEKEKQNHCAAFTNSIKRAREIRKFQVTDLQRWLRNVQKSVMHVQSCCFAHINRLVFLPFSLPSPSLLLKLSIVVILKCCYHGNVTSHFYSL